MSKEKVPFGYIAVERVSNPGKTYRTTCTPETLPIFEKRGYRKAATAPPPVEAKAPEEAKKPGRKKAVIEAAETLTENDGDE